MLRNRLEKGPLGTWSISDARLPTEREYAELRARRAVLVGSLAPCLPDAAARCIGVVLVGHHAKKATADEVKAQIGVFVSAVADLPLWAIEAGCGDLIRRNVAWPPNSGQVRAACLAACQGARDELAGIERILTANVYHEPTAPERARIAAGFEALVADLKLRTPYDPLAPKEMRPPTRDEAAAWLEREAARPSCPGFSAEHRRALGLPEREPADEAAA